MCRSQSCGCRQTSKVGVTSAAIAPNAPAVDLAYGLYVAAVIATSFYLMHVRHVGPLPVMLGCGALNLLVAGLIM